MKLGALHLVLFAVPLSSSAALAGCLQYEPAKVTLTGVIHTRVDPGPPGYGEAPKTDSKEAHLYLHLDKAICVDAKNSGEGDRDAAAHVKMMEMAYFVHQSFRHEWLGKHVSVTGTLFEAETAHHWTPVLIMPTETHVLSGGGQ